MEIRLLGNLYGAKWYRIDVSKEIRTEISWFSAIEEIKIAEILRNPEIYLFQSEQTKI